RRGRCCFPRLLRCGNRDDRATGRWARDLLRCLDRAGAQSRLLRGGPGARRGAQRRRAAGARDPVRHGARPLRGRDRVLRRSGAPGRARCASCRARAAAVAAARRAGSPAGPRRRRLSPGARVLPREGLSGVPAAISRVPPLRGLAPAERALALTRTLDGTAVAGHTTNLTVADAEGNACVLTTSLGLGSGDFVPALDLHLNSMLGETDLIRGRLEPGERMESMMAPSVAFDGEGLALAAGAAGGTRLRGALVQVVAGILDERLEPEAAVTKPRLHPAAGVVHLEPGFEPEVSAALEEA